VGQSIMKVSVIQYVHNIYSGCHYGMARPRAADRVDGLQMWRVAENALDKESRTADKGWSSTLGVWRWASNSST